MAEDLISIGIALDTSQVLQGARQVDAALKQVAAAGASTAQSTKAMDQAAKTAGQSLRQQALAAQDAAQKTTGMKSAADAAAQAMGQNLAMAVAAAAQSMIQAQREAKKVEDELRRVAKATEEAEKAAALASITLGQKLGGAFRDVGQQAKSFALAQIGVSSIQSVLSGVVNFAQESVRAALQTESLTAAFKAIEGSGQAAGRTMQFLKDTANRLGVDVVALTTGFKTIDAASRGTSLQGEQIRKVFVAMAEASRVLGLSGQDLNGVLLAVGQSISKGTVQAEELRGQIGERLPGAFQIAARAMGVTTAELDKMMERGELQATTFWPRFAETIRKEFGGSVEEASKTAGAAFERFHNTMREFQVNVGQLVIPPLQWIIDKMNAVVGAANKAKDAIAAVGKAGADAQQAQTLAGGKDVASDLQKQFVAAQAEERAAREARQRIQGSSWAGDKARLEAAQQAETAAIDKRIALAKQLEAANKAAQRAGDPLGEGAEVEPGAVDEKRVAAQKQLVDMTKANREELEKLDRVTQQLYGRKPTQDEILKVTEKQVETTRKWIDANQQNWNLYKDTGPAKELRAQAAGAEALEKSIKAAGEAGRAGKKEAGDAAREEERLRKEREQAREQELRLDKQQADEVGRTHQKSIESLRQLNAKYTEAKTETDADRASKIAASLAYSQHTEEANKLAEAIGKATKALEDQRKVEEKLPGLREDAQASKSVLDDLNRLQKQLEPSRRSMTTEERLAGTRAEIAAKSGNDPARLKAADEQMKKTLDTELWQKWEDAGLDALDHVGKALEEFVFKGKFSFKDLLGSIAQDIFRASTQILAQQATKKGGWLEMGLNLLQKVPSLFGGGSGGGGGTGSYIDADFMQHGGEAFAGRPYIVGEAGPELFVPRTSGTVVPHGQGVSGPTVVNVHVSGVQDAQSFVQSRGAVSRAMMGALSQARQQM